MVDFFYRRLITDCADKKGFHGHRRSINDHACSVQLAACGSLESRIAQIREDFTDTPRFINDHACSV
jgi:hypothetical protein